MKIAFFSPFPPKQTGVAAYSEILVRALRSISSVTAFDHDNSHLLATDPNAVDFARTPEVLAQLHEWDLQIFSLGNNPYYHLEILRTFFRSRGLLLLHDTVLYFLFAGMPAGSFHRHFCETYGADRASEIESIRTECPEGNLLRYQNPARYSFLAAPIKHADGIIVHNRYAADAVREAFPGARVHILPLLAHVPAKSPTRIARAAKLRDTLVKHPGQMLFGTFGFLGSTKRLSAIRAALGKLAEQIDWHLVIVGDGPDPMPEFAEAGFGERVTWRRYVSDEDYDAWIEASDLVLNLRYPSMGESSATLSRAMGMGKACIVTNHGSFTEFPDDTVVKVPHDDSEPNAVASAIMHLCSENTLRHQVGDAAQLYTIREHAPNMVALRLIEIATETVRTRAQQTIVSARPEAEASCRMIRRFEASLKASLPTHLRADPPQKHRLPKPMQLSLTAEDVTWAYRVLLARDPHPELEIPSVIKGAGSMTELRKIILGSDEFLQKNRSL